MNALYGKLDVALYLWFRQQRERGSTVTGPILLEKAAEFHDILYSENPRTVKAILGFQNRFSTRFGRIKSLVIAGVPTSADEFVVNFPNKYSIAMRLVFITNCCQVNQF